MYRFAAYHVIAGLKIKVYDRTVAPHLRLWYAILIGVNHYENLLTVGQKA